VLLLMPTVYMPPVPWALPGKNRPGAAGGRLFVEIFTGGATTKGSMTWKVEVAKAGRYEAVVHYTCPAADVGSVVELMLNRARWSGKVAVAHDPPLRGKENDRVPRKGESYVKDFRPLSLGTVDVPAGRGTLTLRATKVAGKHVADVRGVELILKE